MNQYREVEPAGFSTDFLQARVTDRADFITRVYLHVFGAIVAFGFLELLFFSVPVGNGTIAQAITAFVLGSGNVGYLVMLGAFMVGGWIASHITTSVDSIPAQYAGLGLMVALYAVFFAPILFVANTYAPGAITSAAVISGIGFTALTAFVLVTRKDFSFLRAFLFWGFILALVVIVAAVFFNLDLGIWFSIAMIGLAGGAILYDTSNVLHHYPEDRYVAASLSVFSSVMTLFYYVLRLLMQMRK